MGLALLAVEGARRKFAKSLKSLPGTPSGNSGTASLAPVAFAAAVAAVTPGLPVVYRSLSAQIVNSASGHAARAAVATFSRLPALIVQRTGCPDA